MNKSDLRIQKIILRSDGGLNVDFMVKLKKGKGFIWSNDTRNNGLQKHPDLEAFEDQLRHHAASIARLQGVFGLDPSNLSQKEQNIYDAVIGDIVMNSVTFSSNDEGQIYAVILSAKMKVLGGLNYNIVTPQIQLEKVDVYDGSISLKETCESLINEVFLWITDAKSSQVDLFTEAEKEEEAAPVEETEEVTA